jgi:hypothetical protein
MWTGILRLLWRDWREASVEGEIWSWNSSEE